MCTAFSDFCLLRIFPAIHLTKNHTFKNCRHIFDCVILVQR